MSPAVGFLEAAACPCRSVSHTSQEAEPQQHLSHSPSPQPWPEQPWGKAQCQSPTARKRSWKRGAHPRRAMGRVCGSPRAGKQLPAWEMPKG